MTKIALAPQHAPTLVAGPNRALMAQLDALRPPHRSFIARLVARFVALITRQRIERPGVGLAELVHSNMALRSRSVKQLDVGSAVVVAGPPRLAGKLAEMARRAGGDAAAFEAARAYALRSENAAQAAHELAASESKAFIDGLLRELQVSPPGGRGMSASKARALAESAYAGLVAGLVTHSEDGGQARMRQRIAAIAAGGTAATPQDRLTELAQCENDLRLDLAMSTQTRMALEAAIRSARVNLQVEDRESVIRQAGQLAACVGKITIDTPPEALTQHVHELIAARSAVDRCEGLLPIEKFQLREQLAGVERHLNALIGRDAMLASLHEQPKLQSLLQGLHAGRFVEASEGLQFILDTVGDVNAAQTLAHLSGFITDERQLRWLADVQKGDAGIIDMMFSGARWDDDAYRLKRAPLDQECAQSVARAEAQHNTPDRLAGALASIHQAHDKALLALDVQHNRRMAAAELDRVMQAASRGSKSHRHLPTGAFTALSARSYAGAQASGGAQPSGGVVPWLVASAGSVVKRHDLLIADWILLSLWDPATGKTDEAEARRLIDTLGLSELDIDRIHQHVKAGFKSAGDVVACRQRLQAFAADMESSPLLGQLHEKRFIGARIDRITEELIAQATGRPTEVADDPEVAKAMLEKFAAIAPWVKPEAELAAFDLPDWVHGPRADRERVLDQHRLITLALINYDRMAQPNRTPSEKEADAQRLADYLADERLQGFNLETWRCEPGRTDAPNISQLAKVRDRFKQVDAGLKAYDRLKAKIAAAGKELGAGHKSRADAFIQQAVRIAILQEAAIQPEGFVPQGHTADILKRLKAFGLDTASHSPYISEAVKKVAEGLSTDKRTAEQLCADFDPANPRNKVAQTLSSAATAIRGAFDGAAATPPKASPAAAAPIVDSGDQAKLRRAEKAVDTQLKALETGHSFAITFGVYGEATVKVPVPAPIDVGSQTGFEQHRGVTVIRDARGHLSVQLHQGRMVRQGFSVSSVRNVLQANVHASKSASHGDRFDFNDNEAACREFLLSLVRKEPLTESAWADAMVQRTTASARDGGAVLTATVDGMVAKLVMEAEVRAGSARETRHNQHGTTERFTRQLRATARIEGSAVKGKISAESETGIDLQARKTLEQRAGMLTGGSLEVVSSVVGGNVERSLRAILPKEMAAQLPDLAKRLGELDDGTEVSLRFALSAPAVREARGLLDQAQALLLDAALTPAGLRRQQLEKDAQALVAQAYQIPRAPSSYRAESLHWTARSQLQVEQSVGGLAKKFARDETRQEQSMTLDTAAEQAAMPSAAWVF